MTGWGDLAGWDAVTVRPLSVWRDGPIDPRPAPFRAPWAATVDVLDRELAQLHARRAVLELAITEADLRIDGKPRARAVAAHPGVVLSMDTRHGPLRYATAAFDRWQDNVRAIGLALEALRKVDRYGVSRRGEQYRGWRALEADNGVQPFTSEEEAAAFIVARAADAAVAHGAAPVADVIADPVARGEWFRRAARRVHPDAGGDAAQFRRLVAARDYLNQRRGDA